MRLGRSSALELVRALRRENEQLREAPNTRIVIEQAKGAIRLASISVRTRHSS